MTEAARMRLAGILFFLSGVPALLYQIVWQRALFAIFGTNIEAVTVVVTAFMLGLGAGSLAGGYLSRRTASRIALFGLFEVGIGGFGLVSLALFRWVAQATAGAGTAAAGLLTLALVLVPTVLMGATLPLLVAHAAVVSGNTGWSVGTLYFVNTAGSAAACFLAAEVTMRRLGMTGSVALAAGINLAVGTLALAAHFRGRGRPRTGPAAEAARGRAGMLPLGVAVVLAGLAGMVSLGYEIVWYRVYAFASGGSPKSFAYVLGAFLAGIACGSLASGRLCLRKPGRVRFVRRMGALLLGANLAGFAVVPAAALAVRYVPYAATLPLVALAAGLLGTAFPLVCHVSILPDERAGAALSYLYVANIAGSALGSFAFGFVVLDMASLRATALALALGGLALATALYAAGAAGRAGRTRAVALGTALGLLAVVSSGPLFAHVYERLQWKSAYPGSPFVDIVETRSGVITVDDRLMVYGGGVFDGMLVTDPTEYETPVRPFSLSVFHAAPKEVLIVGMASGAWAQVIANHPQVERVTIVEINPGYLTVIRRYEVVAPLLKNPKVEIAIDDGRRWMVRNPGRKYDAIVMDTVQHWRALATNLLSREFLQIARAHLKPGGLLYYNTTHSPEAQRTGVETFPYGYRFGPFLAVSDRPVPCDVARWRRVLTEYRLEGEPVFNLAEPEDRASLEEILAKTQEMETAESVRRRTAGARAITDDNMASEWTR